MRNLLPSVAAVLAAGLGLARAASAQPAPPVSPVLTFPVAPVQPGGPNSFQVHLDGRFNWYAGVVGTSVDNSTVAGISTKLTNYDFQGYIRLYPGFDAVAANGLKYGVAAEIRNPGAGGGTIGHGTSPPSTTNTLFWRRAYGYVGTDELGTFRFGMGDSVTSLFQVGVFEGFNDGGWDGDVPNFAPANAQPIFPFTDVGQLYTTDKIVYLSPTFSGFKFGAGFEPNIATLFNDSGCISGSADIGCNRLASTGIPGASARRRNTADIGAQYTGAIGPLGIESSLTYIGSGTVSAPAPTFEGLSVGNFGLELSYAGFTAGGHLTYGVLNADYDLKPKGGQNGLGWLLGAQYAVGPVIVGASYFNYKFAGNWTSGGTVARAETDQGIAAGGTYTLAPGLVLYLSYLYGQRHQAGFDFLAGAPGTASNNTHANIFALGAQMSW